MTHNATEPTTSDLPAIGLIGCCFHIFDAKGAIRSQGVVRGYLGEGYYLVQYFDWIVGSPSTMEVRPLTDMKPGREDGCWQFYENNEHMKYWHEYQYKDPNLEESGKRINLTIPLPDGSRTS